MCAGTECGSVCVNLASDANNCGACGHSCQTGACSGGKCQPVTLASGRSAPWGIAVSTDYLYWVERGPAIISRMTLADGTASPLPLTNWQCNTPVGAVTVDAFHVYWDASYVCREPHGEGTDENLGEPMWTLENTVLSAIALNSTSVYAVNRTDDWLTSLDQGIYSNLQASEIAVAADDAGLYWLEWSTLDDSGRVMRTDPTSIDSGAAVLTSFLDEPPREIAVYNNRVYWTASSSATEPTGAVYSVSTAGGGVVQIIATDQTNPTGIAVDASGVYWTNRTSVAGSVMRASLLGNDAVAIAIDQSGPNGITLDSEAIYWTNSDGGEVMMLAK